MKRPSPESHHHHGIKSKFHAPGMRRVRLLCWKLYYQTPLRIPIEEWVERGVARHCKISWADYCQLKEKHADIWLRWSEKRERAKKAGRFPPQPVRLLAYRKLYAKRKALLRKERPSFTQWAWKEFAKQRRYKRTWRRERTLDRLLARFWGFDTD